jgi:hypothetical protein
MSSRAATQTASRPACQPASASRGPRAKEKHAHGPWPMAHGSWIMDTTRTRTGQDRTEQNRTGQDRTLHTHSTQHTAHTPTRPGPAASNRLCSGAVGTDLAVPVPEPVPVPVRVPVCARTYTWSSSTVTWMLLGPTHRRSLPPTPPSTCTSTLRLHFCFASALSVAAAVAAAAVAAAAAAATAAVATAVAAAAKPTSSCPPLPLPLPLFPPSSRDGRRTPRPLTVRLVAHLSSRGEPVGSGVCNVVECAQHSIIECPAPQHPSTHSNPPGRPRKSDFSSSHTPPGPGDRASEPACHMPPLSLFGTTRLPA